MGNSMIMKIKCAAIKDVSGKVFTGKNHAVCYQLMKDSGIECGRNCVQGFVTECGKFVDRYEAAEIAFKAGQTKKLESPLFSEDLTGDWFWLKDEKEI